MNQIEVTILSIIIMIGLGYFLKRIDFLSEKDIDPFNKIVMYILLPCMIFHALKVFFILQEISLCESIPVKEALCAD